MRNTAIGMLILLAMLHHTGCSVSGASDRGGGPNPGMPGGGPSPNPSMPGGGPNSNPEMSDSSFPIKIPSENAAFFDDSSVIRLDLTFSEGAWADLIAIHQSGKKDENLYVHCGVAFGSASFPDAACRPKGRSADWKNEPKPQFAIRFDHWNLSGQFLKVRRLNLEAVPYNPAPVRDRLGLWLMRQAGLHTPRVNHVKVYVNGEYYGLYMNIENIEKEFLDYHFQDPTGNLYTDDDVLQTNIQTHNVQDVLDLEDLVSREPASGDHTMFFSKLEAMIDIHSMLLLTAAEVVLPTGDNWSNGTPNYFLYHDPLSNRFVYMPWDLDTFLESYSPPDAPIYNFRGVPGNPPNKELQLAFQNPAWKQEYEDNLVRLRDGPYSALPAQVTVVCDQVRADFVADPNKTETVEAMNQDCQSIKDGITKRIAYLKSVLGR